LTDGSATDSVELGGQMPPFLGPGQQRMRTAFPGPGSDHMLSLSPRSSETGALGVNMAEYVLDGAASLASDQDSRLLVMPSRFVSCLAIFYVDHHLSYVDNQLDYCNSLVFYHRQPALASTGSPKCSSTLGYRRMKM